MHDALGYTARYSQDAPGSTARVSNSATLKPRKVKKSGYGRADSTQVTFQLAQVGLDDGLATSHRIDGGPQRPLVDPVSAPAAPAGGRRLKSPQTPRPRRPLHPLRDTGIPLSCVVQFVEVQTQLIRFFR